MGIVPFSKLAELADVIRLSFKGIDIGLAEIDVTGVFIKDGVVAIVTGDEVVLEVECIFIEDDCVGTLMVNNDVTGVVMDEGVDVVIIEPCGADTVIEDEL